MSHKSLTEWLLFQAMRERNLLRLAMALRVHKPEWGSQATLVAVGLSSFLDSIDWDTSQVYQGVQRWLEEEAEHHEGPMRTLRFTQLKELTELVNSPRDVVLYPNITSGEASFQSLLAQLANHGLLHSDVIQIGNLVEQGLHNDPRLLSMLPEMADPNSDLAKLITFYSHDLSQVTLDAYFSAVRVEDRHLHPNMLLHVVLQHWEHLGRVSSPSSRREFSPVNASLNLTDSMASLWRQDSLEA